MAEPWIGGQAPAAGPRDAREVARALEAVPGIEEWPDIDPRERGRRMRVLADIRARIQQDGPRRAAESDERGRLFMPFAALKGYGELTHETEEDVAGRERGFAGDGAAYGLDGEGPACDFDEGDFDGGL